MSTARIINVAAAVREQLWIQMSGNTSFLHLIYTLVYCSTLYTRVGHRLIVHCHTVDGTLHSGHGRSILFNSSFVSLHIICTQAVQWSAVQVLGLVH
jgi:hypothetical protein